MMPNATSILRTLPGGMRAVVTRDDGAVASLAVRSAIQNAGTISLNGIESQVKTAVWTLVSDFKQPIRIGDVLTVDQVPGIVTASMTTCGNLVNRAQVLLCEDTVTISDTELACQLGSLGQDMDMGLGGFLPEDMQGFFMPESLLPEGVTITQSTSVVIAGETLLVEKVSRNTKHAVLCVTCRRRGDA